MITLINPIPIYTTFLNDIDTSKMLEVINLYDDKARHPEQWFSDDLDHVPQLHSLPEFKELNEHICHHIKSYMEELLSDDKLKYNIYIQKSWGVRVQEYCGDEDESVAPHCHPNGHLSLVFYLDVDEEHGSDLIFGELHDCLNHLPFENSDNYVSYIKPRNKQLVIFPSHLEHAVRLNPKTTLQLNQKERSRYSISYDIMITSNTPIEATVLDPKNWKKL